MSYYRQNPKTYMPTGVLDYIMKRKTMFLYVDVKYFFIEENQLMIKTNCGFVCSDPKKPYLDTDLCPFFGFVHI